MRNITHIPSVYLLVSLRYVSIKFGRILQLKDAKRYAIDKKQHIGNTHIVFHAIGNLELIDSTEDIAVCIVKVNKTNIEVHTIAMTGITVGRRERAERCCANVQSGFARERDANS